MADVGLRIVAIIIDSIILALVSVIIMGAVIGSMLFSMGPPGMLTGRLMGAGLVVVALNYLYFTLFEAYMRGQTPGKMLLKIRVVKVNGEPIGIVESLIRNILRIVDGFFAYLVGFIVIIASEKKQRIGDMAAGTIVVKA